MKVNEYYNHLKNLIKTDPKILDYEVVFSSDQEGNNFYKVVFRPGLGYYDQDSSEFVSEDCGDNELKYNALCIN